MSAKIIDGNQVAASMREEMKAQIDQRRQESRPLPGLAVVLVGDDPASVSYVRGKRKMANEVGIHSVEHRFPADFPQAQLLQVIACLNQDPAIHGILVQLPLPPHLDENTIINALHPDKDVDGLHPVNLGQLLRQEESFLPCTPHGVQQLLLRSQIPVAGKHVVVVGRSALVGRPLANILLQKREGANATVTVCHTGTPDLGYFTRQADILVVAAGRPGAITADMVRGGSTVIDVGVTRVEDASRKQGYRLVGDVDFAAVAEKAGAITPVPGGVGPMTITMLLHNTLWATQRRG
ncbi:MAG: bifunctional methylenetetrahydrofolate dehydrogenase/methenyltetrahydrofolate cyclohydrolase FolD [Candidatus Handelsmanbacteria bacterium]|nr:bifunctional methylenetetrahydrofolate dehydrogenase/methenyltetrahydrofolate cyclohydrolase FolD [Candidatus Handelsmanbacteria bacterium]